jgi:nitrate reductase gamma subunit
MSAETIFWIVHLPMMVLFLLGMWLVFANWLQGSVNGQAEGSSGRKTGAVIRSILRTIFSRKLPLLIKAFFVEAWFNRRLFRNDWRRWISHFALVSGFLLLMTLSGFSALADKFFLHFWHQLEEVPWIAMWANPDHPITAMLNELGALLMTGGLVYFLIRRSRGRADQLRTGPMDTWMLVGLGLILLSGWITTIVRLNSSHVEPPTYFAPISYVLALLFRGLPLPWDKLFDVLYVLHGILTSVVIVTIPFSKFMHVIAGALVTMINQVDEDAAHRGLEKGAAHGRA